VGNYQFTCSHPDHVLDADTGGVAIAGVAAAVFCCVGVALILVKLNNGKSGNL
jgi:hypothetical protein